MKFRVKEVPGLGFFAQVKFTWFANWCTIRLRMDNTYCLFRENNQDYPLENHDRAEQECREYFAWKTKNPAKPLYHDVDI